MLAQTPYSPDDLAAPPLDGPAFVDSLDQHLNTKLADLPGFYGLLVDGKLDQDALRLWVKDLYRYWNEALYYSTGAIFVKTNHEETRTNILRKLVDIEGKEIVNDINGWDTPAYEELWLRFGEAIGVKRDDVESWKSHTRTHYAMDVLGTLSRWWEWSWLDGIAAMYAGDMFLRWCLAPVQEALKSNYGVGAEALRFFDIVLNDLAGHVQWEAATLRYWACTTERQLAAARAFRTRLDLEDQLLVATENAVTTGKPQFQIP